MPDMKREEILVSSFLLEQFESQEALRYLRSTQNGDYGNNNKCTHHADASFIGTFIGNSFSTE